MSMSSSTVGGSRTKYKIIFLGEQSVGKSSIIERYIKDKFDGGLNPTVGIDFHIKNISRNNRQYRIQLWDTAGQQRFRSLIPGYMKDANCAIMVYDTTKPHTLTNLKLWCSLFEEHQSPDAIKVFVGNKVDLTNERDVPKKDGEQEALKYHSQYFEVSAKSGKKVEELFGSVVDLITEHLATREGFMTQEQKKPTIKFPLRSEPFEDTPLPKKKCC